ncbi:DUF6348 family protein [Asticcacaulis solisilvae]|uniref:DUF6348 family protein n=1 Tax=Asticcacaulis solisilvae TaxID=1217274 RepID=UPI003FD7CE64
MFGWFKKRAQDMTKTPSVPAERSLVVDMHQMLTSHGIDARIENDWTLVNNDFPLLGATRYLNKVTETSAMVQIDFALRLEDGRSIVESYAGWGEDIRHAEGQGLFKFCVGAMHVFLSTFWNHHEPDQVDIKRWSTADRRWDAYISSLINNTGEGQKAGRPADYMDRLQDAVSGLALSDCDHWISVYVAMLKNEMTVEIRLDNEISEDLTETVRAMDWPTAEGFYSQRQFILLRPVNT